MNLDNNLIFFVSALGAFNSLLLGIYFLFFIKPKKSSNYFLGGLLIALSIRVWKSLFFYFNPDLSKLYLQIGLSACFFIGPFLYLYLKSKTSTSKQSSNTPYYLLTFFGVLVIVIGTLYPYQNYPKLWTDYFYKIINYQWFAFIIASTFLLKDLFKRILNKKAKVCYDDIWIISIYLGILVIWFAYFTANYTSYIAGALSFSFAFYLSGILLFYRGRNKNNSTDKKEKYANSKISDQESELLLKKLDAILIEDELFKNPNLTLSQLAKKINIRPHLLSQLLNDNLNKSFSLFINEYRIQEAKRLLKIERNLKMEIIAEKSGFNSNSTFYTAFKKIAKTTPAKYIQK